MANEVSVQPAPVPSSSRARRALCAATLACLLLAPAASAQSSDEIERIFDLPPRLATFLRGPGGLSYGDLVRLRRGDLVIRELERTSDRGAAFIAVVAVDATSRVRFRRGALSGELIMERPEVLEWGRFSSPPGIADLQGLTWDDQDFADLPDCRVGDCKVKLTAGDIRTLHAEVDFDSVGARAEATELLHRRLLDRMTHYLHAGDAGLGHYRDKNYALSAGSEAADLVRRSPFLSRHSPALQDYLLVYPEGRLPGARDVFFWSKEDHGTKRHVTALMHGVVWEPPTGDDADVLLLTKQLYANHYFEGELGITLLVPAPGWSGSGHAVGGDGELPRRAWLVHVYRGRLDVLRGFGLFHGRVRSGVQEQVEGRVSRWLEWLQGS